MSDDRAAQLRSLSIDSDERAGADQDARRGVPLLGVIAAMALTALISIGGAMVVLGGGQDAQDSGATSTQTANAGGATSARQGTSQAASQASSNATGSGSGSGAAAGSSSASDAASNPRPVGRLVASGYVTARRQATVSAEITGRVLEIYEEEGVLVEEGQILARLDDARARIALELAEARALSARAAVDAIAADLAEARLDLDRTTQLNARTFATDAAVDAAEARVASLAAQLRRARADANAADLDVESQADLVERHLVRAPFTGVIVAKNAQAGEIISPTSAGGGFTRTGVYTLVDMNSLEIEVDVNEGSIGQVEADQRVEAILDAYPNWRIPAHVEAIIPTADRSRATIQVRVAFDEIDGRILPDMAAKVTFLAES